MKKRPDNEAREIIKTALESMNRSLMIIAIMYIVYMLNEMYLK